MNACCRLSAMIESNEGKEKNKEKKGVKIEASYKGGGRVVWSPMMILVM